MSAFFCNDEHTSIVADFIKLLTKADDHSHEAVFAELRMQNLRSLIARYPQDTDYWLMHNVIGYQRGQFKTYADAVKLAKSYGYQSCEHQDWPGTHAAVWLDRAYEEMALLWGVPEDYLLEYAEQRDPEARWVVYG